MNERTSPFHHLIVVAGAGMSADSGLPTFADIFSVWGAREGTPSRAALESGHSPLALFRRHPELAWPLYLSKLEACQSARIHRGYIALLKFSRHIPGHGVVLTSNVDGLFLRAGFPLVHECHGQIARLQCGRPCAQETWLPDIEKIRSNLSRGQFPTCPHCRGAARPNISWGDSSFAHGEGDRQAQAFAAALASMHGRALIIECGVSPASGLRRVAENLHHEREESFLLRINPEYAESTGDRMLTIPGSAESTLVQIAHEFQI